MSLGHRVRARWRLRRAVRGPYEPATYWEARAEDLIATYDRPDTWSARGWLRAGVEEVVVPKLLDSAGARSVIVPGAGSGRQYAFLLASGMDVRGFDISPRLVAECLRRYPDVVTTVDVIDGAPARLPPADAVVCTAVLQHIPPDEIAAAAASVRSLARKLVVIREHTRRTSPSTYVWAHDYDALFHPWRRLHDEVTDEQETFAVSLRAYAPA